MSLCNFNWKKTLEGETHPKPDVDFIVNGEDGQRSFLAHRLFLAMVSPIFKEQFYGENSGDGGIGGGERINISLDTSYNAAEAFFKYIYEKCLGKLAFQDLIEVANLSERYQMEKLTIDVKELIVKFMEGNKEEVVEEIVNMKKNEKESKDKVGIVEGTVKDLQDRLGDVTEEKNSLERLGQQCAEELEKKNKELEQVLERKVELENNEVKIKLDMDALQKDKEIVIEENKKLKHDIERMAIKENEKQREEEVMIGEMQVLVKNNKDLQSKVTDIMFEKDKNNDLFDSLKAFSLSNGKLTKENDEMRLKLKEMEENVKVNMMERTEKIHDSSEDLVEGTHLKLNGSRTDYGQGGSSASFIVKVGDEFNAVWLQKVPHGLASRGVIENIYSNGIVLIKFVNYGNFVNKVGDSFKSQWFQDGLLSNGVIQKIYPNEKVLVKFLDFGIWDQPRKERFVLKSSNKQTQTDNESRINTKPACSTSNSEIVELSPETKEKNSDWSYSEGTRTIISIPTNEDYQEIKTRVTLLESRNKKLQLENKYLKEKGSTSGEVYKKALRKSNVRNKNITEEMETMKAAYGTQIEFLKKENESLKVRYAKEECQESGNKHPETPLKDFKESEKVGQAQSEISSKVNLDEDAIDEELTEAIENLKFIEAIENLDQKVKSLKKLVNVKNGEISMLKAELKQINEEFTDTKETGTSKNQDPVQLKKDLEDKESHASKNQESAQLKKDLEDTEGTARKTQEWDQVKKDLDDKIVQIKTLKSDLDDKTEQVKILKTNVVVLKKAEKTLVMENRKITTEKTALQAIIKSLNDQKTIDKENEQLMSVNFSTDCGSPLLKKQRLDKGEESEDWMRSSSSLMKESRLSFSLSDEGEDSEDLRASLDQRKMRRVVNNDSSVEIEMSANDEEQDDYFTIEIGTASEETDDGGEIEDGDNVESVPSRSVDNSPARASTPLRTIGSRKRPHERHNTDTPSPRGRYRRTRTQSPRGRDRRIQSPRGRNSRTQSPRGRNSRTPSPRGRNSRTPSPRGRYRRTPSPRGRVRRTQSPRRRGPRGQSPRIRSLQASSSRNYRSRSGSPRERGDQKSSRRRQNSSPRKGPRSSERVLGEEQEREDLNKIRVTVPNQKERIADPSNGGSNDEKYHCIKELGENVDEDMSRNASEENLSIDKERMRIVAMEKERIRQKLSNTVRKRSSGSVAQSKERSVEEERQDKKSNQEDSEMPPEVEEYEKGKVFQRLGGKTAYLNHLRRAGRTAYLNHLRLQ